MPTTQITEITASVDTVGSRTNSAGSGVSPDWSSEERRMGILGQFAAGGIITPVAGWQVVAGGGGTMNIVVGSGATKVDIAALIGTVAGQGAYLARLDQTSVTIALDAAHATLARIDEVYLVVYDNAYDSTSRVLPRLVVRKGDNGGGNPGVDSAWKASLLLSRINIPGGAANIAACTFTDLRPAAGYRSRTPYAKLYKTANQTLSAAANPVDIIWEAAIYNNGMWVSTANTQILVPHTGLYDVKCQVLFSDLGSTSSLTEFLMIWKNHPGVNECVLGQMSVMADNSVTGGHLLQVSGIISLAAGDQIKAKMDQSPSFSTQNAQIIADPLAFGPGWDATFFEARYVGQL